MSGRGVHSAVDAMTRREHLHGSDRLSDWVGRPGVWLYAAAALAASGAFLPLEFEAVLEIVACATTVWAGLMVARENSAIRWPWWLVSLASVALAVRGLTTLLPTVPWSDAAGRVALAAGYVMLAVAFTRVAMGIDIGWDWPAALDSAVVLAGLVGSAAILQIGQFSAGVPVPPLLQLVDIVTATAGVAYTAVVIYGAMTRRPVPVFYQRLLMGALLATLLALLRGVTGPADGGGPGALAMIAVTVLALTGALRDPQAAAVTNATRSDGVAWSLLRTGGLFAVATLAVVAAAAHALPRTPEATIVLMALYLIVALLLIRAAQATRAHHRLLVEQRVALTTDPVTGLSNLTALLDPDDAIAIDKVPSMLVRIWLDDLDDMSDTAGTGFANEVERAWSTAVARELPAQSHFFRIGVGQYAVVVPNRTDLDAHETRSEISSTSARQVEVEESPSPVTVRSSTAAAFLPDFGRESIEEALALAALAHRAPQHRSRIGSEALRNSWARRTELSQRLLADRDWKGLVIMAQPFVRLDEEDVVGYECLCRWRSPSGGLVPPNVFLPTAEALSLMPGLDGTITTRALRWPGPPGGGPGVLSINIDPESLLDGGVIDGLLEGIGDRHWAGSEVWLEVLEKRMEAFPADTYQRLELLERSGFRIAIDDFAAGASTLTRLHRLRATVLKLDRALVENIDGDPRRQAIVRGIVAIANDLGAQLVAEGVETPQERDVVRDLGCELAQGFLWARPCPLNEVAPTGTRLAPSGPG